MTYATRAALGFDAQFRDRIITCSKEQALVFKDDGRPDIAALARSIIENPGNAQGLVELVVVAPDFVDVTDSTTVEDPAILSAVQANWPTYAEVVYEPEEPPVE
jgi:hypothetical protein